MHRFFLPPDCISIDSVVFPEETARQVSRVLRLLPGEHVIVLDNKGSEFEVVLADVDHRNVSGKITERKTAKNEPVIQLTLYICITQREKFEWILQKCTEIGVNCFVPVISSRSLVQQGIDWDAKRRRWEKIIKEAAEQSGRGCIPSLSELITIDHLAGEIPANRNAFILWENEEQISLRAKLKGLICSGFAREVSLLIGPEGGFSEGEIEGTGKVGFIPVSLGKRIFRMETAAIVASALVLYEMGDLE